VPDGADTEAALATLLAAHARRAGAEVDLGAAVNGEPDAAYRASRALNRAVVDRQNELAGQVGEASGLRAEVTRLAALVEGYRRGRVMRLLAAFAAVRRRLGR
jgi:hypothetical protein